MIRRARLLAMLVGASFRVDRRASLILLTLITGQALMLALTGLTQRWLVDSAATGTVAGVLLAAAVGALAFAMFDVGDRSEWNLRMDLGSRVNLEFTQEFYRTVATRPTVDHLERREYLDRITLLRGGSRGLVESGWVVIETCAGVVSLALSIWLLADVTPAVAALALLTALPLVLTARGERAVRAAVRDTALDVRFERELHGLCVDPGTAKELLVSGSGAEISRRAAQRWEAVSRRAAHAERVAGTWKLVGWLGYTAGLTAALAAAVHLIGTGRATIGDLVLLITIATRLQTQTSVTIYMLGKLGRAWPVADAYLWLRDREAPRARPTGTVPQRITSGIELRDVSFRYPHGDTDVLREVNLTLPAGATVAVVGVNGAGKSTLVKLLGGYYAPSGGGLHLDGVPLTDIDAARWRAAGSGVAQNFSRFQVDLAESVAVGNLDGDLAAVERALARAGAADLPGELPDGLKTRLGVLFGGVELSGGQWQKLAIARGMMRERPLLLMMDEPTAALDPDTESDVLDRLLGWAGQPELPDGAITVIVSHRLTVAREADLVIYLDGGRVTEFGTHAELMALDGGYAALYSKQAAAYR